MINNIKPNNNYFQKPINYSSKLPFRGGFEWLEQITAIDPADYCPIFPSNYTKKEVSSLVSQIDSISNSDIEKSAKAVSKFLVKMKNINVEDFNKYIQNTDFKKLYKLAPYIKDYTPEQFLTFFDFYYKNNVKEFDKTTLTFKNDVTEFLSKNYVNADKLQDLFTLFPLTSRKMGSVPQEWLSCVAPKEQEEAINNLYKAISDFEQTTQGKKCAKKFQNELSKILNRTVKVKIIDNGAYGIGYKISSLGANSLCLKTFFDEKLKEDVVNRHGQFIEPQTAIFANLHSKEHVKCFFGKLATEQNTGGFLVTQFLDENTIPFENEPIKGYSLKAIDVSQTRNRINGKIIDFGYTQIKKKPYKNFIDKFLETIKGYSKYYVVHK